MPTSHDSKLTSENTNKLRDRYHGALLGLAAGDALGTTLEFQPPGMFALLTDMVGGGPFNLQPGQWTDDTSMALCLAESLVRSQGFDPKDQMERYVRWWRDGYMSCTGQCFDIGMTCRAALTAYRKTGNPFAGSTDPRSAGNGSLMRLAPISMAYRANRELAVHYAAESSRTTHGAPAALDACRYYAALIIVVTLYADTISLRLERTRTSYEIPISHLMDDLCRREARRLAFERRKKRRRGNVTA